MPQLPSGRRVGICISPAIDNISRGDFAMQMKLLMGLRAVEDVKYLATVVYYRDVGMDSLPIEPYAAKVTQLDIDNRSAGWIDEDYTAFAEWQQSEAFRDWAQDSYEEVREAIRNMKTVLPEALHGLFESDD